METLSRQSLTKVEKTLQVVSAQVIEELVAALEDGTGLTEIGIEGRTERKAGDYVPKCALIRRLYRCRTRPGGPVDGGERPLRTHGL